MGYLLILRSTRSTKPLFTWGGLNGADMTASQATELLLHIAAAAPELHCGPAYLAVVPVRPAAAAVPTVPEPKTLAGSGVRHLRRLVAHRLAFQLAERHVATGELVRPVVDGGGRGITRAMARRLVRAEYAARPSLGSPSAWTVLRIEPLGASA